MPPDNNNNKKVNIQYIIKQEIHLCDYGILNATVQADHYTFFILE